MDRSSGRRTAGTSSGIASFSTHFGILITAEDESRVPGVVSEFQDSGEAVHFLDNKLSNGSPDERWWAVRLLSELEQDGLSEVLCRALTDPDSSVRQCAALCLRKHPYPCAIPELVYMLSAEDRLEARLAGDALVRQGGAAISSLLYIFKVGPQAARVEAIRALALMDDLATVPALFAALDDESALIEHWADEGLQRRGIGMVFYQ